MRSTLGSALACALAVGAACNSTTIESSWKDPTAPPVGNVLVAGISGNEATRRNFEETMASQLQAKGVRAMPLSQRLPSPTTGGDKDALREQVKAIVQREGYDAVLTGQLVGKEQHVEAVPDMMAPMGPMGFYGYWDAAYPMAYSPGYLQEETEWRIETRLFDARGDGRLSWSMTSDTFDPASADQMVRDVSKVVVDKLQKDGLLRASPVARRNPLKTPEPFPG